MSSSPTNPTVNAGENTRLSTGSNKSAGSDGVSKLSKGTDTEKEKNRQGSSSELSLPARCINPASEINSRLDTQVEVRVYPCNNSQGSGKKKFTTFTIKPEVRSSGIAKTNTMDFQRFIVVGPGRSISLF